MNFIKISIIKTLFTNFYYFGLSGVKSCPIIVYRGVKLHKMGGRNAVEIGENARIHIGMEGSFCRAHQTFWAISNGGRLRFNGNATISKGTQLICDGEIEFGSNFYCNVNCIINCGKKISFGNDVLIGWDVTIIDGDGHYIGKNGAFGPKYDEITIGNHVWIASYSKILKGSVIYNDSVIAMNALVSKQFEEEKILIGGVNKVINTNIDWKRWD